MSGLFLAVEFWPVLVFPPTRSMTQSKSDSAWERDLGKSTNTRSAAGSEFLAWKMTDTLHTPLLGSESQQADRPSKEAHSRDANTRLICVLLLMAMFLLLFSEPIPRPPLFPVAHDRNPSYLVSGRNGAVASEEARCSAIGIDSA